MSALTEPREYVVPAVGQRIPRYSEPVICGPLGERVIRCRDCQKYKVHTRCRGICLESSDIEEGFYVFVDIDGFCYLAEPKEVSADVTS